LTLLEGSDPSVTYTVSSLPDGATFDPVTALFDWKPGYGNAGKYNVTFTDTDDGNGTGVDKSTSNTVPSTVLHTNRHLYIAVLNERNALTDLKMAMRVITRLWVV